MKFAGLRKTSLIDWPGHIASVIFTGGCNMDCFFCHNRALIKQSVCKCNCGGTCKKARDKKQAMLDELDKRRALIDGVVITGGEPTLQRDLLDFMAQVKEHGFKVKLDSNGSRPEVLREAIERELVDYIAMDVKAPRSLYETVVGVKLDMDAIDASIQLLKAGAVDYEFRTTCIPQLNIMDMQSIGQWIKGARHYYLQQYQAPQETGAFDDPRIWERPHDEAWFERVQDMLKPMVSTVEVRGIELPDMRSLAG